MRVGNDIGIFSNVLVTARYQRKLRNDDAAGAGLVHCDLMPSCIYKQLHCDK